MHIINHLFWVFLYRYVILYKGAFSVDYKQELALYPGNYEAKLRLLTYEIKKSTSPAQQLKLREQAHQVIADRFNADPGNSGNLNKVTMGYLIIGENTRLDSIRKVVMDRYPESAPGRELTTTARAKGKDTTAQIALFEKELQKETADNRESFVELHDKLFHYYAARKNSDKALYHARFLTSQQPDPYKATTWQEIAQTLLESGIVPDSARAYAQRALDSVHTYPVGVIRYFPETGYIYPYADDSTRQAVYRKASHRLHALLGLIDLQLHRLEDATAFYQQTGNGEKLAKPALGGGLLYGWAPAMNILFILMYLKGGEKKGLLCR